MSNFLVETNVISEASKPRPNSGVLRFFTETSVSELYISTVSLAELQFGADMVASVERANTLRRWIENDVRSLFSNRVFELSEKIILRWIGLVKEGKKANRTYAQPDLFLAATALEHNLTLVTRNTRDLTGIPGLQLLNPWEPTA